MPAARCGAGATDCCNKFHVCKTGTTPGWQLQAMTAILSSMDLATQILIVDDDAGIRSLVSSFLQKHGFKTDTAGNPAEMRAKLTDTRYDLIVLDVMMPGEDGLSALRKLQTNDSPPVIMLSAVGTDIDRVVGLEMGADDYLAKPCNPRELLARIRTVLRRRSRDGEARSRADAPEPMPEARNFSFAGWRIDMVARTLHDPAKRPVALSDGEFRLLRAMVEHPRRVLTRDQLMDYASGSESDNYDRAIDVQISRLRRKLAANGEKSELIRTVRSEGYMFAPAVRRI
jgi:two-component system OmpR family response regulator